TATASATLRLVRTPVETTEPPLATPGSAIWRSVLIRPMTPPPSGIRRWRITLRGNGTWPTALSRSTTTLLAAATQLSATLLFLITPAPVRILPAPTPQLVVVRSLVQRPADPTRLSDTQRFSV